tara:strand:- start:20003 stop:21187 length:1185 start_codon:yes stop_codon:yes gene_type:complete
MDISQIIIKILKKQHVSIEEKSAFNSWILSSSENRSMFNRLETLVKEGHDLKDVSEFDLEQEWLQVINKAIQVKRRNEKNMRSNILYKYAAIFVGVALFSYGAWKYGNQSAAPVEINDSITLQLENGDVLIIPSEGQQNIVGASGNILGTQNGSQIAYSDALKTQTLSYNTLNVPYGKIFTIILSDQTKVYLNAGSSLKYPVKFIEGQNRQVYLTGEAYFEVHKDKKHPFILTSGEMDLKVLGTKFNVSAYPEDANINTVLVEGSVSLYNSEEVYNESVATIMKPGYKAEWGKVNDKVVLEAVDTDLYTSWIEGKLVINEMLFKNIIRKLERKYNVKIVNKYEDMNTRMFTARFDIETIEDVLKSFQQETIFDYKIEENNITIYPPKLEIKSTN